MVSDLIYYCRVKGNEQWDQVSDHPSRPLAGVVSLWAKSNSLEDKMMVEIKCSEGDKIQEIEYIK